MGITQSTETKELMKLWEYFIILYGVRDKTELDNGSAFMAHDHEEFCKMKNKEFEDRPLKQHTGTGAVKNEKQTLKNLIITVCLR